VSPCALVLGAAVISLALAGIYLAFGGGSYEPTAVADPCEPRPWRDPEGIDEAAEQFTLSALDGAACELQVSRERLSLALATPEAREAFADEYGLTDEQIEDAVRAGLERAIDDAEAAGALPPLAAGPLRELVASVPIEDAIALIQDASEIFSGEDLLDRALDLIG
jgi:hypothetical protein